ncbi:MAG: type I phosphomannose isomerase catalytic subunit [Bacteroidota bacterium]
MSIYPLKFKTIYKEKLWGGEKVKTVLNKDFGNLANCGETWELSGVSGNISEVSNGTKKGQNITELIEMFKGELVGERVYQQFGNEFPLLIKFIDAAQDLSIQVHPDDALAKERHNGFGKTEMWYILQADPGATLISGFNKETNREEYLELFNSGKLMELLNQENVNEGDVFFLPAGRVHTIGKGLLLAEIQQTSDITYRIYDFDRVDKDGNKRELHVEEALDAIDFKHYPAYKTPYPNEKNQTNQVVTTPFFTTNKYSLTQSLDVNKTELDSFKIYIGVGGSGKIAGETIGFGEVMLVPANVKEYSIEPDNELELLESYIEI